MRLGAWVVRDEPGWDDRRIAFAVSVRNDYGLAANT